jgi:hypothetical protein
MMIVSIRGNVCAPARSAATPQAFRRGLGALLPFLIIAALASFNLADLARAAEPATTDTATADRIDALRASALRQRHPRHT